MADGGVEKAQIGVLGGVGSGWTSSCSAVQSARSLGSGRAVVFGRGQTKSMLMMMMMMVVVVVMAMVMRNAASQEVNASCVVLYCDLAWHATSAVAGRVCCERFTVRRSELCGAAGIPRGGEKEVEWDMVTDQGGPRCCLFTHTAEGRGLEGRGFGKKGSRGSRESREG